MEKFHHTVKDDITQEDYHGSGPLVASAGYAYLSHLGAVVTGMLVTGTAAYFSHGRVNQFVDKMRGLKTGDTGLRNWLLQSVFGSPAGSHELNTAIQTVTGESKEKLAELIAHQERGFFENEAVAVVKKLSKNKKAGDFIETLKPEKLSAAFMGAGLGAGLGYISSSVWAFTKGCHEGNAGKKQFARAKEEIIQLRAENDRQDRELRDAPLTTTERRSVQHEGMLRNRTHEAAVG